MLGWLVDYPAAGCFRLIYRRTVVQTAALMQVIYLKLNLSAVKTILLRTRYFSPQKLCNI